MGSRPPYVLSRSRTYPVEQARAFDVLLPASLPDLFDRRSGVMPAIREVRDQTGPWSRPGETRTVVTTDGGRVHEVLVAVERPQSFSYRVEPVAGPVRHLMDQAEGTFDLTPVDGGVEVTWTWRITPKSRFTALAMPVFAASWQGFARKALERLGRLLQDEG